MDNDALTYGLRARAAQLLTWLTSVQQQERQQHSVQADRLTNDGADRGSDDPDNRRAFAQWAPSSVSDARAEKQDLRRTVQDFAHAAAQHRQTLHAREVERGHQPEMDSGFRPRTPLAAQVEYIQRLQAQQQTNRQQGRGQGRGW